MSSSSDRESHPTLEQSRLVSQFLEWTGSTSDDFSSHENATAEQVAESQQEARAQAIRTLTRYDWNLQKALEDHLLVKEEPSRLDNRHVDSRERPSTSATGSTNRSPSTTNTSSSVSYFWLILQYIWQIFWLPLEYLLTEPLHRSREYGLLSYAEPFPTSLGENLTSWSDEEGSLSKLLGSASYRPIFYVVYIDSRHHMDSLHNRSVVLQDARIKELFRSNDLLFYDLDVTSHLGWHIVLRLNLTNFPVLVLIRQPTNPTLVSTQVLSSTTTAEMILEWIQREKQKLTERSAETQLREEQESAYKRSLSIDRAKAEQKAKAEAEKHLLTTTFAKRRMELESERKTALQSWQKERTNIQNEQKMTQRLSLRLPSGRRILLDVALASCSLLSLYGALYAELTSEDEIQEMDASEQDIFIWTLGSHYPRKSFALHSSTKCKSLLELAISDGMTLYAESTSLREQLEDGAMATMSLPSSSSSSLSSSHR